MPNPLFHSYLTIPWKSEYVKQKKNPNHCVLCAIVKKAAGVKNGEVFRYDMIIVLLNHYPYNPGHLLIAPLAHYEQFENVSSDLADHLTSMLQNGIRLLKLTHQPSAFNIGLKLGHIAETSIKHLH